MRLRFLEAQPHGPTPIGRTDVQRLLGINTWVWTSPLTDQNLPGLLERVARLGFDAVELPLETVGAFTADVAGPVLEATGLVPYVVGAMAPGRDLVASDRDTVRETQQYLRACLTVASELGAGSVSGPFYSSTGRVWRMSEDERNRAYTELRENLLPVAEYAASLGVAIGVEPLNRYETSLLNTVEQALDALGPVLSPSLGLALDSYHLNIEQRSSSEAIRAAAGHIMHVQVCGSDRGAPGGDQTDWSAFLSALDDADYRGPLNIESFTAENASIATAASIWRPLASSQDRLAVDGLAFLRGLVAEPDRRSTVGRGSTRGAPPR